MMTKKKIRKNLEMNFLGKVKFLLQEKMLKNIKTETYEDINQ